MAINLLRLTLGFLLVAATALSRGWDVVTRDRRSFPKIPDLVVRVW
jgi:predicted nucleic acid-binding protein